MFRNRLTILAALIALCFVAAPVASHAQVDISAQKDQKQKKAHQPKQRKIKQHKVRKQQIRQQNVRKQQIQRQKVHKQKAHKPQKQKAFKAQKQQRKQQKEKARQFKQEKQKAGKHQREERKKKAREQLKQQKQDVKRQKGEENRRTKAERKRARKLKAEQHKKAGKLKKQEREKQRAERKRKHEKARVDRKKLREKRKQAGQLRKDGKRAAQRAKNRVTRQAARKGRFAKRFRNRNLARVRRARWAPLRAWRRGYRAAFVAWVGPVFWPYAYVDLFNFTFWPEDYYDGYWAFAYDDFFNGIWWSSEPAYASADIEEGDEEAAAPAEERKPPPRVSAATRGEAACGETGKGVTAWPFDRMKARLNLTEDQRDLMEELRQAALDATEALRTSCPKTQPRTPVERLQAISDRLHATYDAIKTVRAPLEKFYASLDEEQRVRFSELRPRTKITKTNGGEQAGAEAGDACREAKPGLVNLPILKIQEEVKPTEDQMDLLDALENASFKAVEVLKAACPEETPQTPTERLAATQTRVEALIKAADAIRPALEDFYEALNDEQKSRFDSLRS